jgi:DNA-binding transcriptional MerR regulator
MSPKSRRSQKRGAAEEARPRPRLHAHHRIRSDPVRVDPPLTIDQHLSNYHQSLRTPTPITERFSPVRFNFPLPLSSAARSPSNLKKVNQPQTPTSATAANMESNSPSPTLSHSSSSTSLPSIQQIIESRPTSPENEEQLLQQQQQQQHQLHQQQQQQQQLQLQQHEGSSPSPSSSTLFYQHRPLTYTKPPSTTFPYTLLHPAQQQEEPVFNVSQKSGNTSFPPEDKKEDPMDEDDNNSPSSSGLLQLAHIVSTFG